MLLTFNELTALLKLRCG